MQEKHNQKIPAESFCCVIIEVNVMYKETDSMKKKKCTPNNASTNLEILSQEVGVSRPNLRRH